MSPPNPQRSPSNLDPERKLLSAFARDLSTMIPSELNDRWGSTERRAIDMLMNRVHGPSFAAQLETHNPIFYLSQRCWFDNDPSLLHIPLHKEIVCEALLEHYFDDSKLKSGLLILIQRDSFKTTFTQGVFPMFIALRGKHVLERDERIALFHHKEEQASANLLRLKSKFYQHPWVMRIWPEFCRTEDWDTKTRFDWPNKKPGILSDPSVIAAGMGARLTGFHQDWQIYDDVVTEDHIKSKVVRDEAFAKYQASRFMLDTLRGKECASGTRYHINDLWSKILKARVNDVDLYKRIVIKAIEDDETLSFPTRHTYQFLERKRQEEISRSGNDMMWWLQYQNEPRSTNILTADPTWIRWCKQEDISANSWRVVLVDGAWKGTHNSGSGDYASIQVWAFERRGALVLRYLLDGVHSNELSGLDGEREIFRLMHKYSTIDVAVEEHGGSSYRTALENSANTRGVMINIIDLKMKQTKKTMRMVTFLKELQAGRIFICKECSPEVLEALVDQITDHPQLDHDDALDCASYSSDPNIQEQYTPMFNSAAARNPWLKQEPPAEPRTRYCGL